jgi:YD repeat-containing protein
MRSGASAGKHRHYNYDALGELTSWSDAKGQIFSQTYDVLSRPLVRTEPDLTTTWNWGTSAARYNIGQLQSVSANSYSESSVYDSAGRMINRTVTIPSDGTYAYDVAYNGTTGLLDSLTYIPRAPLHIV